MWNLRLLGFLFCAAASSPLNFFTRAEASDLPDCFTTGTSPITFTCRVDTVVGIGPPDVGDGGPAREANLLFPLGVLARNDGFTYIADSNNNRIRLVTPEGDIQTIAGTGSAETQDVGDGLPATEATVRLPRSIAIAPDGALIISDSNHYLIRRIDNTGIISTIAGNRNPFYFGEGIAATEASFAGPQGIAIDQVGNIYVADEAANRVRRIDLGGIITTIAGTGVIGTSGDGGPATMAMLDGPASLAIDSQNSLFIGTFGGVRRVNISTGIISSVPGTTGRYVALDTSDNLFFTDSNQVKRRDSVTGMITVIAGTGESGFSGDGGSATVAKLNFPTGLSIDQLGNVYVADSNNNRIRRIKTNGQIETFAGGKSLVINGQAATTTQIFDSQGLSVDRHGNLYFTDFVHHLIRRAGLDGIVTTVAGTGMGSFSGDGGPPLQASFSNPTGLIVNPRGDLLFIDETNSVGVVRLIDAGPDGVVTGAEDETIFTVAGQLRPREEADHGQADGGPATSAVFVAARFIALDATGNLYISDTFDHRIRKVVPGSDGVINGGADEIITTVAGDGVAMSTGDGGPASQSSVDTPGWLAVDSADNLYFSEITGKIRRIDATTGTLTTFAETPNLISFVFDSKDNVYYSKSTQIIRIDGVTGEPIVIAGTGELGFGGDGGHAPDATFVGVGFIALDNDGDLYGADNGNFRIRKITFSQGHTTKFLPWLMLLLD